MKTAFPPAGAPARDELHDDVALRGMIVLASLGAAAIHFAFAPAHLDENSVHGAFFIGIAWLQLALGVGLALRPSKRLFLGAMVVNAVVIAVWLESRTIGISGEVESVGLADGAASALAALVVVGSFAQAVVGLPRRRLSQASSGAALGAAAVAVVALVSASMVPSLGGGHDGEHAEGEADDHGAEATAGAAAHDHETTDASGVEVATDAAGHDDGAAAAPVAYDPTQPIDLGGTAGVTPEQQAAAENLIAVTLVKLPQWTDPDVAEAAGFRSIGDGATGVEHFVNQDFMDDDTMLDPDKPESLVYDTSDGGRRLAAAMFMTKPGTALDEVPEVGGALMQWHVHDNLCFNAQGRVAGITNGDGECPPGLVKPEETPMIHVWIESHPCGPFAALEGIGGGRIPEGEERLCDTAHGAHGG
ncbi:hypothetical protein BH24ACT3_BH24ACT3_19050 [soil metagenome]